MEEKLDHLQLAEHGHTPIPRVDRAPQRVLRGGVATVGADENQKLIGSDVQPSSVVAMKLLTIRGEARLETINGITTATVLHNLWARRNCCCAPTVLPCIR